MATLSKLQSAGTFDPRSWFCTALREWHGEQPACGVPTVPEWSHERVDPALGPYRVPTHAAWFCDCGAPRYGGVAPGRPTPHLVLLFVAELGALGAHAVAAAYDPRSSE